jgi:hypothetical protein
MKKILCLCLALLTLCTFVACGPGGDTNMHKLMKALKDGDVVPDESSNEYFMQTSENYSSQANEDYTQVRAYVDGTGHYKHRLDFRASKYQVVKDTTQIDLSMEICWWVDAESRMLHGNEYQDMAANTISIEVEYEVCEWNAAKQRWDNQKTYKALLYNLSMDTYYQNGEFTEADATVAGDGECTAAAIALFNEAFNALHEIYAEQGYPFK